MDNFELFIYRIKCLIFFKFREIKIFLFGKLPNSILWKRQWYTYFEVKKFLNYKYNLSSISQKANNYTPPNSKNVWVYWNTGFDSAPELVKMCFNQLKKSIPKDYQLRILTADNLSEYIVIPHWLIEKVEKKQMSQAHFSDIIRLALLYCYGGLWIDATCFLTKEIPNSVLKADFFVFQSNRLNLQEVYSPIKCSNWFIFAKDKNNYLLGRILQILMVYWKKHSFIIDYYLFHITLAALVDTDRRCKKAWEEMPYICNMNPHTLQLSLAEKYTDLKWNSIIDSCFIQKLTYKYKRELLNAKTKNMLQYFMEFS